MEYDRWRQWQAFADQLTRSHTHGARDGAGFAPFVDAAERFTAAARSFFNGADKTSAPAAADAARIFSDFLREQFADFQPQQSAGSGPAAGATPTMNAPALGPGREHQQRWQRTAEAWRRMEDSQRRLQRLWGDALREAATEFVEVQGPPQGTAISAEALRKVYDAWIDCAEEAYARTAHGAAFCDAQSDFVNASSEWRRELRASIEQCSKQLDLPTRSEINSLTHRLKALEAQLGASRKYRKEPKPRAAAGGSKRVRRKTKR